ncbi:MAG: GDP-mannose 4,6-dehydratase [Chloroflexota bacterium]|nr:GDP-mannose 4,6-dehydratase [Chloroflexota bacterium]
MKILVTGAAGFVGSRLARALLERGDEVVGLDNFNDYYDPARKEHNVADLAPFDRFTLVRTDIRDAEGMRSLFESEQVDAVAHLAAMAAVRYSVKHPLIYGEVNVQGTMNLLDAARQSGQPRMILASTGSVYGRDTPVPFTEDAPADRALAPYPASKRAMEVIAHSYHHLWELPTTILRFFNVYGPHGRPDMMPWHWTEQILRGETLTLFGGGRLERDWTYIDDIVAGFVAALDAGLPYEIINLGCSRPIDNLHFVRTLEGLLDREARIEDVPTPPSEPFRTYADVSKARALLDYEPTVPVEEGLARFVAWYRKAVLQEPGES